MTVNSPEGTKIIFFVRSCQNMGYRGHFQEIWEEICELWEI